MLSAPLTKLYLQAKQLCAKLTSMHSRGGDGAGGGVGNDIDQVILDAARNSVGKDPLYTSLWIPVPEIKQQPPDDDQIDMDLSTPSLLLGCVVQPPSTKLAKYKLAGTASDSDGEADDVMDKHHCTDVPCCCVFIAAIVGTIVMCSTAAQQGGVGRLYAGIQADGLICGVDQQVQKQPYLAWCYGPGPAGGKPTTSSFTIATSKCVTKCPSSASGVGPIECPEGSYSSVNSRPFLGRYCLPEIAFKNGLQDIADTELGSSAQQWTLIVSSIGTSWQLLVFVFFLAFVMGFLYLGFLRCCAEGMIWSCIFLSFLGFGGTGIYLWVNASSIASKLPADMEISEGVIGEEENIARGTAMVCLVVAAGVVCLACCLGSSIKRAVSCVEAACEAIYEMPSLLMGPAVKAMVQGVLAIVLLYGYLTVYSAGNVSAGSKGGVGRHVEHTWNEWWQIIGFIVMAFWIVTFVDALFQFTMAFAFATYYYKPYGVNRQKDVNGFCAVAVENWPINIGVMYHAGSLAFGSLLVAVLHALQKLMEYARVKNQETVDSALVKCVLCCVECLVGCCAEAVEVVNKNAYIDMAVSSNGFCVSAREAMDIIVHNAEAMSILNGATYVFTVFGALFIINDACGAFASRSLEAAPTSGGHLWQPPIVAFSVSLSFMNVFDMASDTLLYCYAKDKQNDNGANTAPASFAKLATSTEHSGVRADRQCDRAPGEFGPARARPRDLGAIEALSAGPALDGGPAAEFVPRAWSRAPGVPECSKRGGHGLDDSPVDLRGRQRPPEAVELGAAITELADVGALDQPTEDAQITPLGYIAMALPCDLRLCRLLHFGLVMGTPCDAIAMVAGLTAADPFSAPSLMVLKDEREYCRKLERSFEAGGRSTRPGPWLLWCSGGWGRGGSRGRMGGDGDGMETSTVRVMVVVMVVRTLLVVMMVVMMVVVVVMAVGGDDHCCGDGAMSQR
ncbi:unnamed protein product [Prorocentrum cordatum]|uniref:Helicase-associated domain-containing protein n=1 Tax=Prorocentrum cordatum TaxID=2364126 RepID=A0ABN9PGP0_9DINO|nr:unnamed protein product [Polarella glacialis]